MADVARACRFVGPFTKDDIARKKLAFTIRRSIIDALLVFLRANNTLPAYRAPPDAAAVAELPLVTATAPGVHVQLVEDAGAGLSVRQRDALEREQVGVDAELDGNTERQHRSVMAATTLGDGVDGQLQRGISLLVRRSNRLHSDMLTALECTFPDLLPFARGGPHEHRATPVSFARCVRHYLMLSSRVFAQHAMFVLVAKDMCGRAAMMTSVAVRVHLDATLARNVASLNRSDAAAALEAEQERRLAVRRGETVTRDAAGGTSAAATLMRTRSVIALPIDRGSADTGGVGVDWNIVTCERMWFDLPPRTHTSTRPLIIDGATMATSCTVALRSSRGRRPTANPFAIASDGGGGSGAPAATCRVNDD